MPSWRAACATMWPFSAEHALDGGAVEHGLVRACGQNRREVERRGIDGQVAREQGGALQHVAQLADVSRPGMVEQRAFGIAVRRAAAFEERPRQRQDVVAALGERGQRELDDAQSR